MGILNMVENIKEIHKEDIVLVKVGTFYYSYGKDAYIISYIFDYKLQFARKRDLCYSVDINR